MVARTEWQIGPWTFDADGGRLLAGETEVPLEHRAARTLELLCRDRGCPVSREAILAQVWEGRSVSANSVAVVIADLRRALGDDAAAPRFIATLPKRGYRLSEHLPQVAELIPIAPVRPSRSRKLAIALMLFGLLASVFLIARSRSDADRVAVIVTPTANDTGQARYQPLATALQALVTDRLAAMGADVVATEASPASTGRQRTLRLHSRLILWNGLTTLSLEAVDDAGHVTWARMAVAPPNGLASATVAELKTFKADAPSR
ncbi:winged helix-turn-helix domain-containing protein [Sphingomonas sp. PAMC 26621]|uniref:winged helix-turn-helix domain-containing protein n=1 Tax=Sphingomonas sp. PAMC 26621 TaxID=1112213 RepID=UPI000288A889|nr:winged helix-turn-helix domain-containing protein [Sphingomonas sp. PAMC 26621]